MFIDYNNGMLAKPAGNSEYEPAITAIPATKTSHVDFGCQQ
jgi:hypothetical protein